MTSIILQKSLATTGWVHIRKTDRNLPLSALIRIESWPLGARARLANQARIWTTQLETHSRFKILKASLLKVISSLWMKGWSFTTILLPYHLTMMLQTKQHIHRCPRIKTKRLVSSSKRSIYVPRKYLTLTASSCGTSSQRRIWTKSMLCSISLPSSQLKLPASTI